MVNKNRQNDLIDWRILAFRIAKDCKSPSGKTLKKGTPVYGFTNTKEQSGKLVGYHSFNPLAITLSVAIEACNNASKIFNSLSYTAGVAHQTEYGVCDKYIKDSSLKHLYDAYEYFQIMLTFSFKAIENFCDDVIFFYDKDPITITVDGEDKNYSKARLIKKEKTDFKLTKVLPYIRDIKSPETSQKLWKRYQSLRTLRNATIHLRPTKDISKQLDKDSIMFNFYKGNFHKYPTTSIKMIIYFLENVEEDDWLIQSLNVAKDMIKI